MNEERKPTFLKVMSIIMIVCGGIGLVASIFSIGVVGTLSVLGISSAILYISAALALLSSLIYLFAGIKGLKACKDVSTVRACVIWDIAGLVALIAGNLINTIWGSGFEAAQLLTGLVVPVLFLVAALQWDKADPAAA